MKLFIDTANVADIKWQMTWVLFAELLLILHL